MICCWTCDQVSGYELSFNNPEMNLMKNEFGRKTKICWARIHCKCLYKRMSIILIVLNKTIRCITCINNEITFHYLIISCSCFLQASFIIINQQEKIKDRRQLKKEVFFIHEWWLNAVNVFVLKCVLNVMLYIMNGLY